MTRVVMDSSRHIVSTTITTVGGFLPLILAGGGFWPPFAMAVAGGVLLSSIVSFYFTPAAFRLVYARGPGAKTDSDGGPGLPDGGGGVGPIRAPRRYCRCGSWRERLLRGPKLLQGIGRGEDGPDRAAFDVTDEVRHDFQVDHGGAGEGQIAQVERAQVQLYHRPGDGARTGIAPAAFQHVDQTRPCRTAHDIGQHRDLFPRSALRRSAGARGRTRSAPRARTSPCLASEASATTRAPRSLASCTSAPPTPPDAPGIRTVSAIRHAGAGQHALGGGIGAGECRELRVRQRAVHRQCIPGGHRRVFRETAIAFRSEIAGLRLVSQVVGIAQPVVGDHALADPGGVDPLTHGHDPAARVGTLDARKDDGRAAPGRILAAGRLSCVCRAAGRPVTALEYQPSRVLISVLLRPQAPTLTSTSPGPGSGRGQSVR
jgi:hypothetical protein